MPAQPAILFGIKIESHGCYCCTDRSKLPALHTYQLSIAAPTALRGSFKAVAAERGGEIFATTGRYATCHVPPSFTEPGCNLHTAQELNIDDFQSNRAPDKRYRTAPRNGLWTHMNAGFYHDGRFATLHDVVDHYESCSH